MTAILELVLLILLLLVFVTLLTLPSTPLLLKPTVAADKILDVEVEPNRNPS